MRGIKDDSPYLHDILDAISAIDSYMQDAPEKKDIRALRKLLLQIKVS